jgi:hypothetical protein
VVGVEQRPEPTRALVAVGARAQAEHHQPVQPGAVGQRDPQRHSALDGAVEVHQPLRGRAERRGRVAGAGVVGVGAEREHVGDRLPEHREAALAAAVAERDPAVRQHVRARGARPGRGALRRRVGRRDRARDPGGPGRPEAAHERTPGLERGRRGDPARALSLQIAPAPAKLVGGQLGLVGVDVDRVRVDAHEQVGAVEARLEPDREQRQRQVRGDQRDEVVGVVAGGQLGSQALEVGRGRGRDRAKGGGDQRVPRLPGRGDAGALRIDVVAEPGRQRLHGGLAVARVGQLRVGRGELRRGRGELGLRGLQLGGGGGEPRPERVGRTARRVRLLARPDRRVSQVGRVLPGGLDDAGAGVLADELLEVLERLLVVAFGGRGGGFRGLRRGLGGVRLGGQRVARLHRRDHARLRLRGRLLQGRDARRQPRQVGA